MSPATAAASKVSIRVAKDLAKLTDSFMERTKISDDSKKPLNKSLNKVNMSANLLVFLNIFIKSELVLFES